MLWCLTLGSGLAWASPAGPWRVESSSAPTVLVAGGEGRVIAVAANLGSGTIDDQGGHRILVSDLLPAGVEVPAGQTGLVEGVLQQVKSDDSEPLACTVEAAHEVACETTASSEPLGAYRELRMSIPVKVLAGAQGGEANTVTVTGGETRGGEVPAPAPLSEPLQVGAGSTPFGVERFSLIAEEADGLVDQLAGSHPFQLTTTLDLDQSLSPEPQSRELQPSAPALARSIGVQLPPGLLGNIQSVKQCSDLQFSTFGGEAINACPADTVLGVASVTLNLPRPLEQVITVLVPVFNLVPAPGEPARFGFEAERVPVILDTAVRTSGDYGVDVTLHNATEAGQILASRITLWGEPDSPAHAGARGWACLIPQEADTEPCPASSESERTPPPFLTLPTACAGQLGVGLQGEAWSGQTFAGQYTLANSLGEPLGGLEGCAGVPFTPAMSVQPVEEHEGETPGLPVTQASTASGMNVTVRLPEGEGARGEAALENTIVTLPAGVQLDPSAANGLQACSLAQVGYLGRASEPDPLEPGAVQPLRFSNMPANCPLASTLGTVRIRTPLLAEELSGYVYLAEPAPNGEAGKNPFDSLLAIYVTGESESLGLQVKLAGEISLNEQTGQITGRFENTPQVPLGELRLHFFEGPHASLSTPAFCGAYSTGSLFESWSGTSTPAVVEPFQITSGPDGGPCPSGPLPFSPGLVAGTLSNQAGAFSSFTLTITNPDGDQAVTGVTVRLPPGIAAKLANVTPCPEPAQGQEWACGAASLIGHSFASAGLGEEPYTLPGNAYLTSGYDGAPFGLLVQTPAVAGPFNLGIVNVRSRINVNPHTATVTVTTDPGPRGEILPTRLRGIPAEIKQLQVMIDRPEFQYNPTNCEPLKIEGALHGAEGGTAGVYSPFRATGCQRLPFKPAVTATTEGKTSKQDGAGLGLILKSKTGETHVAKTVLTIPAILPARLSTIQKACVASVFEANPAACPEGSVIGTATVHTPVLKSVLTGPIYLVSHGNAAWPDAELVLQAEGITIILDGQTAIKKGVTTSSFLSVPDAPFETVQAVLPEGPHSALTTNLPVKDHYSLCGQSLAVPAALTGQNATSLTEDVKVAVQGCGAVKASKTGKLNRARQLERALARCRRSYEHSSARRLACEKQARRTYAAKTARAKRALRASGAARRARSR